MPSSHSSDDVTPISPLSNGQGASHPMEAESLPPQPGPGGDAAQRLSRLAAELSRGVTDLEAERADALNRLRAISEEHRQVLNRIRTLEEMHRQSQAQVEQLEATLQTLRQQQAAATSMPDVRQLQELMHSVRENPHHIIFLARLSEHAGQLAAVVDEYVQMRAALQHMSGNDG